MKFKYLTVGMLLVMVTGCSRSAPMAAVPKAVAPSTTAANSTSPAHRGSESTLTIKPPTAVAATSATATPPAAQFSDLGELFAPPKNVAPAFPEPVREPDPQPQPVTQTKKKPELRLVGFVEMDSVKALLSANGKLNVMAVGDSVDGLELAGITPPSVTLKNADDGKEIQINLFEQGWARRPGANNGMPRGSSSTTPNAGGKPGFATPRPRIPGFSPAGFPGPNGPSASSGINSVEDDAPKPKLSGGFAPAALPGAPKKPSHVD